jgi:hypothetical protein
MAGIGFALSRQGAPASQVLALKLAAMRQRSRSPRLLSLARAIASDEAAEPRHDLRPIPVAPFYKRVAPHRSAIDLHGVGGHSPALSPAPPTQLNPIRTIGGVIGFHRSALFVCGGG